ncbi:arginase family protein [Chelatococcus asaccharovorans]|uniref:arginase n=1 Tax=Chelatococcus asaccharovorans TaxID=28210 RepID=UPI00224C76C7|nr:arginase [Chelatococcus asaccharovorans]CAH1660625.1 conserved hypothetical protein [Chelatococcus asaccharovorans]CAH1683731.1 conserved hypothetical protein [Chelatococcus asaccharovorans]
MRLRVIDLDGSLPRQEPLRRHIEAGNSTCIDAVGLAAQLRIVASRSALRSLVDRFKSAAGGEGTTVTFYGSGDFHHLTAALVATLDEPLTIVHFDNHPDWVRFPATTNCGAWVNRALELPHVHKVVTIGPCSADLVRPEWQFANLDAVRDGRIALYPWRHPPSRVWGRYGRTRCYRQEGGYLRWRNLADEDWSDFLHELVETIPTRAVWLTIDKDVLGHGEAVTNWDQGELTLNHLVTAIERLAAERCIIGGDVCGDWSKPRFSDPFRAALAYFDHPPRLRPKMEDLHVNAQTNAALIDCFTRVLP